MVMLVLIYHLSSAKYLPHKDLYSKLPVRMSCICQCFSVHCTVDAVRSIHGFAMSVCLARVRKKTKLLGYMDKSNMKNIFKTLYVLRLYFN